MGVIRGGAYVFSLEEENSPVETLSGSLVPNFVSPEKIVEKLRGYAKDGKSYMIGNDLGVDAIFSPAGTVLLDGNLLERQSMGSRRVYRMERLNGGNKIDFVPRYNFYAKSASKNTLDNILKKIPEPDVLALCKIGESPYSVSSVYRRKIEGVKFDSWMKKVEKFEPLNPAVEA